MRGLPLFVAGLALAGLTACGSSGAATPTGAADGRRSGVPSASASASSGAAGGPGATVSADANVPSSSGAPGGQASRPSASGPAAQASATPSGPAFNATPEELPIAAAVVPKCVTLGSAAKLTVHTVRKASIAFVAVYSNQKSGAAPPWGEGYGGNDKGTADTHGDWSASWTVAPQTPPGPAHVILVVGQNGKGRQIDVPFSVGAREVDGCGT
jgi:hypothetical protein